MDDNIIIDTSPDTTEEETNYKNIFTSSEEQIDIQKPTIIYNNEIENTNGKSIFIPPINNTINAISAFDNIDESTYFQNENKFISQKAKPFDESNKNNVMSTFVLNINNESDEIKERKLNCDYNSITNIVDNMLKPEKEIYNGWDENANITIKNWFKIFKQQSFIYQWILDRNRKISDKLSIASVVSSSLLGIFSGFKLWINDDELFNMVSDILLMFLNFFVAILTTASKRYIDDQRNETIRVYIEEIDSFLGEISAQVLKSPIYRIDATEFFSTNNDKYTKLISSAPSLSINELNKSKLEYQKYINYSDNELLGV